MVNLYKNWLDEDYLIFTVQPEETAAELLAKYGREIARRCAAKCGGCRMPNARRF